MVIVSIDKDLFQLVNEHVAILDTRNGIALIRRKSRKIWSPSRQNRGCFESCWDSSDNIPGAPGIGEKGARGLIKQYGSLDQLIARRDEVSRKSYSESLQQNEAVIRQSLELVTLFDDLPMDLCLQEMEISQPDRQAARELFVELEFLNLLEELIPPQEAASVDYQRVESREGLKALGDRIKGSRAALALLYSEDNDLEGVLQAFR